jgi:hypothetical protein
MTTESFRISICAKGDVLKQTLLLRHSPGWGAEVRAIRMESPLPRGERWKPDRESAIPLLMIRREKLEGVI